MEIKKDPKVNLESRKQTYWMTGLTGILAILFIAFEWTHVTHQTVRSFGFDEIPDDEEMILTVQNNTPPPPPPPPMPDVIEQLIVVDDGVDVAELDIQTEADVNTEVEIIAQTVDAGPVIEEDPDDKQIFVVVENQPEFPGGTDALMEFIKKNLRYPVFEAESAIQGRVTL